MAFTPIDYIASYFGWTQFTPVLPKLYWDVYSAEERVKKICFELHKLCEYANMLADSINLDRTAIKEIEAALANIENLDEIDEQVQALQETADAIQETLDALPDYEQFVGLESRVSSLENKITKSIPLLTDFGSNTISTFNSVMENDVPFLRINGEITTQEIMYITRAITIYFEDFVYTQTVWGKPAIVICSDNVRLYGNAVLTCDVEYRTPIVVPYRQELASDPKAGSSGICLGITVPSVKNTYIQNIKVYNFIAGITSLSTDTHNTIIDYLYVNNVDYGLFGGYWNELHVNNLEFENIASYIDSSDPSHAVYVTGEQSFINNNIVIDNINGVHCDSKRSDSVVQIKGCRNFTISQLNVSYASSVFAALNAIGRIQSIIADNCNGGVSAQLELTNVTIENAVFKECSAKLHFNACTTRASMTITNMYIEFNTITEDADVWYVSNAYRFNDRNSVYILDTQSDTYVCACYQCANSISQNEFVEIYNPTVKGMKLKGSYTYNTSARDRSYVLAISPRNLDYPVTNQLGSGYTFIDDNYICEESEAFNYPQCVRTCNTFKIPDGQQAAIRYFNGNNYTDGNIYTLYNNGQTSLIAGERLITKTGNDYTSDSWKIFRFMFIGNVAVEI